MTSKIINDERQITIKKMTCNQMMIGDNALIRIDSKTWLESSYDDNDKINGWQIADDCEDLESTYQNNVEIVVYVPDFNGGVCGHAIEHSLCGSEISTKVIKKYGRTYRYSLAASGCELCDERVKDKAMRWVETHNLCTGDMWTAEQMKAYKERESL